MGEILALTIGRAERWPQSLTTIAAGGFTVVALTPAADAAPIDDTAATLRGRPVAVLLGAEGPGLSAAALELADVRVRIPMRLGADSLNVGHAAAIAFQRLVAPSG
jgi:tRNA G18 (ribose-2'-O)-methylase SpoU